MICSLCLQELRRVDESEVIVIDDDDSVTYSSATTIPLVGPRTPPTSPPRSVSDIFRLPESGNVERTSEWVLKHTFSQQSRPTSPADSTPQPGPSGASPATPAKLSSSQSMGGWGRFPCGRSMGNAQCSCDVCWGGYPFLSTSSEHIVFNDPPRSPSQSSTKCFCTRCLKRDRIERHREMCWLYQSTGWCDCLDD